MTVALEIQDPSNNTVTGHPNTMRKVQRLVISQDLVRDTANITILRPDGGKFQLGLVEPKTFSTFKTGVLHTNMSAWEISQEMQPFYTKAHDAMIKVSKTMYMENGTITAISLLAVKTVFSVQV
jgi:hypothetical protein